MAQNLDFKKIIIKDVPLAWPRLDQPYRYNNAEKRTEACAATVQGAGYSIAWDMPTAEAKQFHAALKAHYIDCRTRNSKLPDFSQVFGMKRDDEAGTVRFTAKRKAVKNDGSLNSPPRVTDGQLNDLADKAIWTGSKGGVRVFAFPVTDPDGNGGISLTFDAVQVTEPVYGGDGLEDDFGKVGPTVSDVDPFDGPAPARQAPGNLAQAATPAAPAASRVPEDAAW
jgi:hypothetical protein